MEEIFLNIAGFNIKILFEKINRKSVENESLTIGIKTFYKNYLLDKPCKEDFQINIIYKFAYDVILKKNLKKHFINFYEEKGNKIITYYHISNIQFQIIIRRALQKLLVKNNGVLLHASASLINNQAYIFLGKSGAGKSTAINCLNTCLPLADDTIILKEENSKNYIYQTPFQEKNYFIAKKAEKYTLGKIFFLKKAGFHKVEKIEDKNIISKKMIEQLFLEDYHVDAQVEFILKFVNKYQYFYNLFFSRENNEKMLELIKAHE